MKNLMSAEDARAFIRGMKRGQRFVYFVGFLPRDRNVQTSPLGHEGAQKLDELARFMLCTGIPADFYFAKDELNPLPGQQRGHLTQRRFGDQHYAYIFTRS